MRKLIAYGPKKPITTAIVDKKGNILSISSGKVYPPEKCIDPTAHSEVDAIRKACKKIKTWSLKGCWLYSTFEPCPLCSSAAVWAGPGPPTISACPRRARDAAARAGPTRVSSLARGERVFAD